MSEIARIVPDDNPRLKDLVATAPEEHRADTDSWIAVVADVSKLATIVASTDFVPRSLRDSAPAVTAAILYGREVGMAPMTALTQVNVIEGRPSLAAEGMRALVYAAGHELVFVETTGAVCTMRAKRHASTEWTSLTWTIDMARAAGLTNRGTAWKSYPRAMLQARCTTEICRMVFPDVIHGFRSVEEMIDLGPDGALEAPETASTPPAGTRVVQRATGQKRPRKKAEAPPDTLTESEFRRMTKPPAPPTTSTGPPLPGEPDYDEPPTQPPDEASPAGGGEEDPAPSHEPSPPPPPDDNDNPDRLVTRPQQKMMFAIFNRLGVGDDEPGRAERLRVMGQIVGHPLTTSSGLTIEEAQTVLDTLALAGGNLHTLHTILDTITDPELPLPAQEPPTEDT